MVCEIKRHGLAKLEYYSGVEEAEMVILVVKGSVQVTVPLDQRELIQVGSRSVALSRIFHLKLSVIHLPQLFLKVLIINLQWFIDVFICDVELRCL